jgi:hypothetical protein
MAGWEIPELNECLWRFIAGKIMDKWGCSVATFDYRRVAIII